MRIGDKTTMKVQVPIIHLVRIFMISRTSTYHNTYYIEFVHLFIMALLWLIILPFLLLFSSKHECQKGNNLSWNPSLERNGYKEW